MFDVAHIIGIRYIINMIVTDAQAQNVNDTGRHWEVNVFDNGYHIYED